MRISSLKSFLQSLCCNSPWNYVAFWKLKYQPEVVLTWEDCFCDIIKKQRDSVVPMEDFNFDSSDVLCSNFGSRLLDGSLGEYPIELAVAEMSSASHVFGKGVVGVAAFTGVPRWVYSDNIAADVFDSGVAAEQYPDEWLLQFVAGIKTILLLPVIPHGVLQLGSVETVAEDAVLVSFVRQNFDSYKICDRYDAKSPIQKFSLMPTDLENLQEPSIITTNKRNKVQKTIHSNGSEACNIFIADQMVVPAFMVQDLCNPFIASLANSDGNPIDKESGLQSLGRLTCEDDKSEVLESILFKPFSLNEKARSLPLCDNFQWMKHGEFVNDLGDFYFEEGSIEPNCISNDFVYDSETGGTLLSISNEYELQKACGQAAVGFCDHIYDPPISGHNALRSSTNDRDLTYWMDLSGVQSAASIQKDEEMEHLLETVVADAYSSTDDNSPNQSNPATAVKMSPGNVCTSSPKMCNKLKRNASGEGNTAPFSFFSSTLVDTGINTESGLSPTASSSESTVTALIDKQQRRRGNHFVNHRKGSGLSTHKSNLCTANNQRPRPRDRQLIQNRIKELRVLVPNSDKCSIDGLLDKTIKHMLFLRDVTNQADKLRHQVLKEETNPNTAITSEVNHAHQNGTSWAVELGNEHHQCPIIVKDLGNPGQMLIEMLCTDHGRFLEIADVIQKLQLTILKAVMEKCSEQSWAHFIVEATGSFQRLDIFWPLMKLLQHPLPIGNKTNI